MSNIEKRLLAAIEKVSLMREAADVIERLTAANAQLREELTREQGRRLVENMKSIEEIERLRADKDEAYRQRNHLVAALARLFPSGIRPTNIEGWEPDWHGCVHIDLPSGQISYHYHDSHAHLFASLPPYTKDWDGHDKETVHRRLAAIASTRAVLEGKP